jgi:uncharacterized sporulation protein YeaH/YhbH (DUF444 family)
MTDSLYDVLRVGERAAARHRRKMLDQLKAGASDLLISEDIVTAGAGKRVRVRVKLLEAPTFQFDRHDGPKVGIGKDGDPAPGDVIGIEDPDGEGSGPGAGSGGESEYGVEMSVDELIDLLMEAWELPNLEAKAKNEIVSEDYNLNDISRKGPLARVHKKRTMRNAIKRSLATGEGIVIHNDDLRFRSPKPVMSYSSSAVIVLVRDRSGSMGPFEMRCSRMLAVWLVQFLRRRYDKVEIRFVLHDHDANEVDEHTFYNVTSGGGTEIATAYRFAQNILDGYSPTEYNRYAVHFSDGDDYDVGSSIEELRKMLPELEAFAYFEISGGEWRKGSSAFWQAQHDVEQEFDNFIRYAVSEESDVADALRTFLAGQPE